MDVFIAMKLAEGQSIRFFFFFFFYSLVVYSPQLNKRIAPPCVARRVQQQPTKSIEKI
jgi:hypothetical protein